MLSTTLTMDNPVFRTFVGYSGVALLKTVLMSPATIRQRIIKQVVITEEDAATAITKGKRPQIITNDPDVERVRRAHRNDLENVLPFVLLGLFYVSTGPSQWAATLHFRIFAASRLIHTFVYLFAVPQPARVIAFLAGFGVNLSLAYNVLSSASF